MSDETIAIENIEIRYRSKQLMLAVLVLSIAAVAAPILISRMFYNEYGFSKNSLMSVLVLLGFSLLVMLLVVVLATRTRVAGDLDVVWYRWNRSEVIKAVLFIISVLLVWSLLNLLIQKLELPARTDLYFSVDQKGLAFFITMTVFITIITPILEELFWRVYVFGTLRHIFGGLIALLGQAVIFGVIHFRPIGGFVPVFSFGLIAGAWRWRRRTLVPIILAHIVLNSLWCAPQWPDWLECTRIRRWVDYVAQYEAIAGIAELDPNENARNFYELARQSAVDVPPEFEKVKNLWPKSWSAEQHAVISTWLSDSEKMLGYLEKGTKKPYYWPGLTGKTIAEVTPELAWVRSSVFALWAKSELSAAEGKPEGAFSDILTCFRLADHLAGRRPIISQFSAFRIQDVAFGSSFRILKNSDVPSETLEHLQRRLEQSLAEDTQTLDFEVERLFLLDSIQSMFTDDGAGNGHIPEITLRFPETIQSLFPDFTEQKKQALLKLNRRRTTILTNRFLDLLDDAAMMNAWQLQNNASGIKQELESIATQNAFISMFGPLPIKSLERASQMRTSMHALIGTLAILRYEADRGQPPSSLQTLVDDGYLEALPQDSFSEGPLVYKQTADGFMLYSYGLDLDDDSGVRGNWFKDKGGDQVFWPVQESNDYSETLTQTKTE